MIGGRTAAIALASAAVCTTAIAATLAATASQAPTITSGPTGIRADNTATFSYQAQTDVRAARRFECWLDHGSWHDCGALPEASRRYEQLRDGRHRFCVRVARPPGGIEAARAACRRWSSATLRLSATSLAPMLPGGAAQPVDVRITNPAARDITLERITVTIRSTTSSGCRPEDFLVIRQWSGRLLVPASATIALSSSSQPVQSWPRVRMRETGRNQDACKLQQVLLDVHADGWSR